MGVKSIGFAAGVAACLGMAMGLGGCSSSFGGGSSPPAPATVVVPPGSTVVCTNGTAPPCH